MRKTILTIALLAFSAVGFAQSNLVSNGDFEAGDDGSWTGNAVNILTENDNSFNFADVETAGNSFDVNISSTVNLTPGTTYTLTFDASSSGNGRTLVAGIGMSAVPFFSSIQTVTLTAETQTFTLVLAATDGNTGNDFGDATSRVLFDMGADTGIVVIDNVSLVEGTPEPSNNILTNGDFESGDDGTWSGNAFNIVTENGNSFNFANVETAGNPFDVNLSGTVTLVPGADYTLTFEASSSGDGRTMIVGIGQSADPFYAATQEVTLTDQTQTFTLNLSAIDGGTGNNFGDATSRVLFDMGADTGVVVIDNVVLEPVGGIEPPADNILTNGDFELGDDGTWFGNAFNIVTEGGNSFNFADVETAGNAFDVNLSGTVTLTPSTEYTLSFDASSSGDGRTMVVGIGQSAVPFYADVETVNLTAENQRFTVTVSSIDDGTSEPFGDATSRVIFDMGADTGVVVIDNVVLTGPGGGGPVEGELLTNGDFEAGDDGSWIGNAANILTEGDNSFNFADVETAGDAFSVNLSQVVEITPSQDYVFTFDAGSSGDGRTMVVGIGLNEADWSSNTEVITLADTIATYSLELNAVDDNTGLPFGIPNSRVIFDMGADTGVVVIDNVSLVEAVGVSNEDEDFEIPTEITLDQNYPNPFNPTTNITFSLPENGRVTLEVFNIVGQRVSTLVDGFRTAGDHTINFNASNLASGIYLYRLVSGNSVQVRKMMLIK